MRDKFCEWKQNNKVSELLSRVEEKLKINNKNDFIKFLNQKLTDEETIYDLFDIILESKTSEVNYKVEIDDDYWGDAGHDKEIFEGHVEVNERNESELNAIEEPVNYNGLKSLKNEGIYVKSDDSEDLENITYFENTLISDPFISLPDNLYNPIANISFIYDRGSSFDLSQESYYVLKVAVEYFKYNQVWQSFVSEAYKMYRTGREKEAFLNSFIAFESLINSCILSIPNEFLEVINENKSDKNKIENIEDTLERKLINGRVKPLVTAIIKNNCGKQYMLDEGSSIYKEFMLNENKSLIEKCRNMRNKIAHGSNFDDLEEDIDKYTFKILSCIILFLYLIENIDLVIKK
ncbi:hypothetical protein [Limosilactobacillus vaginalis]|uniref:hypothetical protein n=1 Tax=Limosilactobacillus vaginalis TaxID=1633 RepID=UPI0024BB6F7E|nr:hypothetical protein [Limosilactobacillus vaginalis]